MNYHDFISEYLFTPYAREFAHLCLRDIHTGSSGVHELGHAPDRRTRLRKGIIPTISLVEDMIKECPEEVIKTIVKAVEYQEKYL